MSEERVMLCYRVAEFEPTMQSVVDSCATCGAAIWLALSSPKADRLLCFPCAEREMASVPKSEIKVELPTDQQLADIKKAMME